MPLVERFWAQVDKSPGFGPHGDCWRWIGTQVGEYGQTRADGRYEYAHRVGYGIQRGVSLARVREGGPLVCHHCDNGLCVRGDHLFLGTNTDNMRDMIRKGRQVIADQAGEANPQAKLTAEQVRAIRADRRPLSEIAADYGIAVSTTSQVRTRKLWPHVT